MQTNWWKRQVLAFLLRQWRRAQQRQATAAARLTTYASQFGQLDWAMKCIQSDIDAWWMTDHNGLSSPVNHRKARITPRTQTNHQINSEER